MLISNSGLVAAHIALIVLSLSSMAVLFGGSIFLGCIEPGAESDDSIKAKSNRLGIWAMAMIAAILIVFAPTTLMIIPSILMGSPIFKVVISVGLLIVAVCAVMAILWAWLVFRLFLEYRKLQLPS